MSRGETVGERQTPDSDELRYEAKWFSIAHRIAVAANERYARHYACWWNPEQDEAPSNDDLDSFLPTLDLEEEVQFRWGLHGEGFPEPLFQNEGLTEAEAKALLKKIGGVEERAGKKTTNRFEPESVHDELKAAVEGSRFESLFKDHVPGCQFDLPSFSDWYEQPPTFIATKSWGESATSWGIVNLELSPRLLWQQIQDELKLDPSRCYRMRLAFQHWDIPSLTTAISAGRFHLLLGIQDVTDWLNENCEDLQRRAGDKDDMLPFWDPASGTRLPPGDSPAVEHRAASERRSWTFDPLVFRGNEAGHELCRRLRHLSAAYGLLAPICHDTPYSDEDPLQADAPTLAEADQSNDFLRRQGLEDIARDVLVEGLVAFLSESLDIDRSRWNLQNRRNFFRICSQHIFLTGLTHGDGARLPKGDAGPSSEVRRELKETGAATFQFLPSDTREAVRSYQEEAFKSLKDCLLEAVEDRYRKTGIEMPNPRLTWRAVQTLFVIHADFSFRDAPLRAVFASEKQAGLSPAHRGSRLRLLFSVLQYLVYRHSPLTQANVRSALPIGKSALQERVGKNGTGQKFVNSRDLWAPPPHG